MKIKTIIKYFLYWQIAILLVVTLAVNLLPLRPSDIYLGGGLTAYQKNPLLNFRANFDGVFYTLIATHGYNYGQQAFFPLYPQIIKSLRIFEDNTVIIGSVISAVSFLMALIVLDRLIRLDYSPHVSKTTIISLLVFPTSFYFTAVYTEGLFFLLVLSAFYLVRTQRPLLGCLMAALAGYTRLIGIFLLPALAIEIYIVNTHHPLITQIKKLSLLLIIPLGLLLYMYHLDKTTGDPFLFYHLQSSFKQGRTTEIILPYQVIWRYIKMVLTVNNTDPLYLTVWLEFLTGLSFLIFSAVSLFRQRLSYALFNVLAFILPTLTGIFTSLPRYVLVCFPAFIIIGQYLFNHPKQKFLIWGVSIILGGVFLSLFARGYWVA